MACTRTRKLFRVLGEAGLPCWVSSPARILDTMATAFGAPMSTRPPFFRASMVCVTVRMCSSDRHRRPRSSRYSFARSSKGVFLAVSCDRRKRARCCSAQVSASVWESKVFASRLRVCGSVTHANQRPPRSLTFHPRLAFRRRGRRELVLCTSGRTGARAPSGVVCSRLSSCLWSVIVAPDRPYLDYSVGIKKRRGRRS